MTEFKKNTEEERRPARSARPAHPARPERNDTDFKKRPERGPDRPEGGKRPRPDTPDSGVEQGDGRPRGATGALIELDKDLMKLLVRRATLVSRIRGGRDHAFTPEAIQAEKAVRIAWENGALAFSKDPRFTRQLFTLLQDLKVLSKEQAESGGSFSLAPSKRPVSGTITGPASPRAAQMYTALAACRGMPLALDALPLSEALMETVRVCAQAGAAASFESPGNGRGFGALRVEAGEPLSFAGKMLFVGDDLFTLCLTSFLSISRPGSCRLTGGARLKAADLSPLRQALPLFGARLAHVIPRSQGLPATLESSGVIPAQVVIPRDLPFEAVCALLLAPLAWNLPVAFNLALLPASVATAALAEVGPIHLACGADVENDGARFACHPAPLHLPERPSLPLDPLLCAYLLSLPAFTGGALSLKGQWPERLPESREAERLLRLAGLRLRILDGSVACEAPEDLGDPGEAPLPPLFPPLFPQDAPLPKELAPLALVLAAKRSPDAQALKARIPALFADATEAGLAEDFCERTAPAPSSVWTSPNAWWSMAFALAAFARPGLKLANPASVTQLLPGFWSVYNSLPNPVDPAHLPQEKTQGENNAKPARRRILAD